MQDLGGGLRDRLCGDMRVGVGGRAGGGEEGEEMAWGRESCAEEEVELTRVSLEMGGDG